MCCGVCQFSITLLWSIWKIITLVTGLAAVFRALGMFYWWFVHVLPPHISPPNTMFIGFTPPAGWVEIGQPHLRMITNAGHLRFHKLGIDLPAPWFIYTFLGIGIIVCFITYFAHIATRTTNKCCFICHSILLIILILLEAVMVGDILFNQHHWEKDNPYALIGEFEDIKDFIKHNGQIYRLVILVVVIIQALPVLLAAIHLGVASLRRTDHGYDGDSYALNTGSPKPLLDGQRAQVCIGYQRAHIRFHWQNSFFTVASNNDNDILYTIV